MPSPSSGDAPAPGPPESSASTRDRLLHAAYDVLVERGYQSATVQAVARKAGLTTGAIYANFGGKQELMAQAVLDGWYGTERAILDEYLAAYGATDPDDPAAGVTISEALTRLMATHVAAPTQDSHRLLTEVTGAVIREDLDESPLLVSVRFVEQLTRASVESGKRAGTVSAALDTDALVAVIVNTYLGAITSKALGLPQPDYAETLRIMQAANAGYAEA